MKNYPITPENLAKAKTICFFHKGYQENRAGRVLKARYLTRAKGRELLVQHPTATGWSRPRWVKEKDVTCIHARRR